MYEDMKYFFFFREFFHNMKKGIQITKNNILTTYRQIKIHPYRYFTGLFACFLVVSICIIIQTLRYQTSVIFLGESERENGQIDVINK